ncbi:MAG: hypothetical protein ACOX7D_00745 [Alphaproteobacteria bacterium]|jgi:hypothetical protein
MKKRYEIILLDLLWLSAIVLFASFWFDIKFNFNIFFKDHWHYLMLQQLNPGSVLPSFYISLIIFIIVGVSGLYFISRPRTRKINFANYKEQTNTQTLSQENSQGKINPIKQDSDNVPSIPTPPIPQRPPKIIRPLQQMITPITPVPSAQTTSFNIDTSNQNEKLKSIFESAGYVVKQPPIINGLKINLWAIGMDETLYIGFADPHGGDIVASEGGDSKWQSDKDSFLSPVWNLNQSLMKIRSLFKETLDDEIQINIEAFVVMNNANITNRDDWEKVWQAFNISVFDSTDTLAEFMNNNKNREMESEEQEDFDAYSDYIDTVSSYFNKT